MKSTNSKNEMKFKGLNNFLSKVFTKMGVKFETELEQLLPCQLGRQIQSPAVLNEIPLKQHFLIVKLGLIVIGLYIGNQLNNIPMNKRLSFSFLDFSIRHEGDFVSEKNKRS